jgi:RNA polymerase sigma factor (sigma-70 family)
MEAERVDPLLVPFVRASDAAESERLLAHLIEDHAEPIITKIVNYKTYSARQSGGRDGALAEAEDVRGEVMLQLVRRLQRFRADYATRPIKDFHSYIAVATYNAYDRYVSRKYPQRRRLKNGLRYLLTHRAGLGLWQTEHDAWVGGLHEWRASALNGAERNEGDAANRLQQLRDNARVIMRDARLERSLSDPQRAVELLNTIFEWTGVPVELDLLTSVVADWWGVTDETIEIDDAGEAREESESRGVQLADERPSVAVEAEQRVYLENLWREIVALPPRQRAALLLNLRDEQGRGVVDLWMLTGVVTAQTIVAALDMTMEQFAEIWNELPLDDNRIAAHLQITRQQVINLRKSARERLSRRMKGF